MSLTTIDKKKHAFKRRVDSEALSVNTIKGMESLVLNNTRKFCRYLIDKEPSGEWSAARDMTLWFGYLMSDIIGDIVFNRNWNMMANEENRPIIDTLAQGVSGLNMVRTPSTMLTPSAKLTIHIVWPHAPNSLSNWTSYSSGSSPQGPTNLKPSAKINQIGVSPIQTPFKTRDIFSALLSARDP